MRGVSTGIEDFALVKVAPVLPPSTSPSTDLEAIGLVGGGAPPSTMRISSTMDDPSTSETGGRPASRGTGASMVGCHIPPLGCVKSLEGAMASGAPS